MSRRDKKKSQTTPLLRAVCDCRKKTKKYEAILPDVDSTYINADSESRNYSSSGGSSSISIAFSCSSVIRGFNKLTR